MRPLLRSRSSICAGSSSPGAGVGARAFALLLFASLAAAATPLSPLAPSPAFTPASASAAAPLCHPASPTPTSLSEEELVARLQPAWDSVVDAARAFLAGPPKLAASSMALSFTLGNRTLFQSFVGLKNASDPASAPDADTVCRLGSVTKLFPAMMALAAGERGKLPSGLESTLRELDGDFSIPDWGGRASPGPSVRSVLYLQMGGLPREAPFAYGAAMSNAEALRQIASDLWMIAPPWSVPSYSNLGFALLGNLVPLLLGAANFSDALQAEVAVPMNLSSLGTSYPAAIRRRMPVPYAAPGVAGQLLRFGWVGPRAGNARVSLRDMDTLTRAVLGALGAGGG